MKKIGVVIFSTLLFAACQKAPENQWPDGVCYEIFIQSFADGNGDGIGDLKGATSKLEYLKDLGVRAVWLMPIMNSPSYHKYDVTDYKSIHPDYGTIEDFRNFVKESHKRNIEVIIDMIINHTSAEHPWFIEASQNMDSEYRDYYIWAYKDSIADQIAKKEITHDSDNITQWHPVNGDTLSQHYYGFFWGGMPDLNYDNEQLRNEIIDIGKWWLTEMDVDGFRLDAAKHIFEYERMNENQDWWSFYSAEMKKIKPDVYIVGEVWDNSDLVAQFVNGLPAMFNFDLAGSINQSLISEKANASTIVGEHWKSIPNKTVVEMYVENRAKYKEVNPEFRDATFLTNHDQNRVMSNLKGDVKKAKLAANILFTLPGSPFLYYGEEIGMIGVKPDEYIREPMIWKSKNDSLRTAWIKPKYSTETTVESVEDQLNDSESLLNHYKEWIKKRNSSEILLKGSISSIESEAGIIAFKRSYGNESLDIYHNLTGQTKLVAGKSLSAYSTIIIESN